MSLIHPMLTSLLNCYIARLLQEDSVHPTSGGGEIGQSVFFDYSFVFPPKHLESLFFFLFSHSGWHLSSPPSLFSLRLNRELRSNFINWRQPSLSWISVYLPLISDLHVCVRVHVRVVEMSVESCSWYNNILSLLWRWYNIIQSVKTCGCRVLYYRTDKRMQGLAKETDGQVRKQTDGLPDSHTTSRPEDNIIISVIFP